MSDLTPADVRETVSVVDAAELLEIAVPQGNPPKIECFLHEDPNPSMALYPDGFFCFGCREGGDVIDFVRAWFGCSFGKAMKWLSGVAVDMPEGKRVESRDREPTDLTEEFHTAALSMDVDLMDHFVFQTWPHLSGRYLRDGWGVRASRWNLLIPHFDDLGRIVGVKTRTMVGAKRHEKKAFPGSTYPLLYCDLAVGPGLQAILCEGESDAWTARSLPGFDNLDVYALPSGAGYWRDEWTEVLGSYDRVFLALDNDAAGDAAADRIIEALDGGAFVEFVDFPNPDLTEAVMAGWRPTF